MSFGENIQFLRKKKNITQEDFAEQLNVSRQTISKWESDASFPEMDKLMQLCDMFGTDMDTLVRGSAENACSEDTTGYDAHYNSFTKAICAGISMIMSGVTLFLLMNGFGVNENICTMVLVAICAIAVTIFIFSGITHDDYVKKHQSITPFYTAAQIDKFDRHFPVLVATAIALLLLGVIWVIGAQSIAPPAGLSLEGWEDVYPAGLIFAAAIAVPILIYAGMQKSKYDINQYNKENSPDDETKRRNELAGKWCGCIMIAATMVFLFLGFAFLLWGTAWIAFVVGGLLCGIVSIIIQKS